VTASPRADMRRNVTDDSYVSQQLSIPCPSSVRGAESQSHLFPPSSYNRPRDSRPLFLPQAGARAYRMAMSSECQMAELRRRALARAT